MAFFFIRRNFIVWNDFWRNTFSVGSWSSVSRELRRIVGNLWYRKLSGARLSFRVHASHYCILFVRTHWCRSHAQISAFAMNSWRIWRSSIGVTWFVSVAREHSTSWCLVGTASTLAFIDICGFRRVASLIRCTTVRKIFVTGPSKVFQTYYLAAIQSLEPFIHAHADEWSRIH